MEIRPSENDQRIGRVVLTTSAVVALVATAIDLWANALSSESFVRTMVYVSIAGFAALQIRTPSRVQLLPVYLAGFFGVLSLIDSILGARFSLMDPGTTLAHLVLVSIAYVTIRQDESRGPIVAFALTTAAYTVLTSIFADFGITQTVGFIFIGTVGQALVLWVVYQLITTLAHASETDNKHARIQQALAECSQALLNRGTPEPLKTALRSLLNATEAYYAYIDVNRIDESGRITWEIVADAAGEEYPKDDPSFVSGNFDQMEDVREKLERGEPAEIIASRLLMPVRGLYESEGIKAELVAPISFGGRWVGSLGYTDHIREGNWTTIEVDGLMRAAEMVGAYWERETAREGLMELAHAKDRFIAAVSHELRTPLSAVVGFAGELASGVNDYTDEEVSEIATMIFTQGLELTHLVDDLLTSERAASGNLTIKPTEISLLDECHDIVESRVLDREVSTVGEPVTAWADSLRTRQIIRNLLTNASRYGGNSIVVEVGANGAKASVIVKDNGSGVRHLDVERIFDPYYRSQGHDSAPDSVGLGLAVARQLARLMGGDIVYRRSDGWTVFELTLPLSGPASAAQASNGHALMEWDGRDPLPAHSLDGTLPSDPTRSNQPIRS